jgi:hypothetical protein
MIAALSRHRVLFVAVGGQADIWHRSSNAWQVAQ